MARSKRLIISGYYGFSNAGDEAVLSAIISGLRAKSECDLKILVLSATPQETANTYNVSSLPRTSMADVSKAVRFSDLLISGGGSLIQDATSLRSLLYYLWVIKLGRIHRRKVMILGQGIGPLTRGISRKLVRSALSGVNLIAVRDRESADLLREIGVTRSSICITADPAFLLSPCPEEHSIQLLSEAGLSETDDIIAVSLRNWAKAPGIADSAADALAVVADKLKVKFLLVTMHTPHDVELAEKIKEKVPETAVQPKTWTAEELIGVFSRCKLVVGMRLHALILAAAVTIPSVGIVYDPKVGSFLSAIGQESVTLDEVSEGLLADRILKAWDTRDELAKVLSERVPAMKEAAQENIRLALELLGENCGT